MQYIQRSKIFISQENADILVFSIISLFILFHILSIFENVSIREAFTLKASANLPKIRLLLCHDIWIMHSRSRINWLLNHFPNVGPYLPQPHLAHHLLEFLLDRKLTALQEARNGAVFFPTNSFWNICSKVSINEICFLLGINWDTCSLWLSSFVQTFYLSSSCKVLQTFWCIRNA